ncbi:hypothetical protein CC80DRAFT_506105 [Byssothecium circinans]|uniref:Uncharacterized protein n=1 Tax=Byssothecium circinans TaxID=147558 RepID=A0A6A5U101_9PLEO|nr:hypothetical protein CC80DRAFT_506105 [Byssothecium circinans]
MGRFTEIPNELLLAIIECVDSAGTLSALSQTCKRFARPASEALNAHTCLSWKLNKTSQMARFTATNQGNDMVKTIRLAPQTTTLKAFNVGMTTAFRQLNNLCACLSTLPNLSAFSLNVAKEVDRWCALPARPLSDILKSLPPSVVNLELDTEGIDGIWKNKPKTSEDLNLCHTISELLPRLETLQLRLSCICTELFRSLVMVADAPRKTSKLRFAAINCNFQEQRAVELVMPSKISDCLAYGMINPLRPMAGVEGFSPHDFFTHVLHFKLLGAFPHLERFLIISWEPRSHVCVRDVASFSMTNYPILPLSSRSDHDHPRCILRGHDDELYCDGYDEVDRALLNETLWSQMKNGARLPPVRNPTMNEYRINTQSLKSLESDLRDLDGTSMEDDDWNNLEEMRRTQHVVVRREPFIIRGVVEEDI